MADRYLAIMCGVLPALAALGVAAFLFWPMVRSLLGVRISPIRIRTTMSGFACNLIGGTPDAVTAVACTPHALVIARVGVVGQRIERRIPLPEIAWCSADRTANGLFLAVLLESDEVLRIDASDHPDEDVVALAELIRREARKAERIEGPPPELAALGVRSAAGSALREP